MLKLRCILGEVASRPIGILLMPLTLKHAGDFITTASWLFPERSAHGLKAGKAQSPLIPQPMSAAGMDRKCLVFTYSYHFVIL